MVDRTPTALRRRLGQRRAGRLELRRLRPAVRDARRPRHRRQRNGRAAHRRAARAALPVRIPGRHADRPAPSTSPAARAATLPRSRRISRGLRARLNRSPQDVRSRKRVPGQHLHRQRQTLPAVAAAADGDFVVVWEQHGQDGADSGVFARRFSSAGAPLATEFQVNSYDREQSALPAVATDADGDFVVAWQQLRPGRLELGIFARRFSSAGAPARQRVPGQHLHRRHPDVSRRWRPTPTAISSSPGRASQDGSNNGVFARRFSSAGAPLGQRVPGQHLHHRQPALSRDGDRRRRRLRRRLEAARTAGQRHLRPPLLERGPALAGEFQVNTYTTSGQDRPSVAVGRRRRLRRRLAELGQDGSSYGVFARRFSSAGARSGQRVPGQHLHHEHQRSPSVAADAGGDSSSPGRSCRSGRLGLRRLRPPLLERGRPPGQRVPGQHLHHERPGSTRGGGRRPRPSRRRLAESDQDGSGYGVFAQRFVPP